MRKKKLHLWGVFMDNERWIRFLLKAKKATYAGKGPEMLPSRPKAHDLMVILQYMSAFFMVDW